ncbi:glycosyltransferase [Elizabethkingia sp. HX XZB]|uniref:glycosyltransferase family 2 protein n=1 Tax=Elizabethkingia sp. HX XZB TaxID=3003193 RepID=UPI002A23D9F1|nr:glycosyltransferase [Elizabethkingia sp. HX XZB]MDX8568442.1 glycosyltransferase [Elizabethkingia sp. HX XZB]
MLNKIVPFICVNYNSEEETKKYIANICELEYADNAIVIVIDNSPTEESFSILQKYVKDENYSSEKVFIIKKENKGYFQGLNDGIEFVKQLNIKSSFFVIGNNDIIFNNDFINLLLNYNCEENVLVLAPDVITTEGSHENPHVINKMSFLRKLKYQIYFSNYYLAKVLNKLKDSNIRPFKEYDPIRKEVYMGIGALYILTPNFFKHFDKLNEEVFLYGEEAILAGQVHSANGKIMYEPSFVCHHNESSTTSKIELRSKYKIIQKSYKIYRKYL